MDGVSPPPTPPPCVGFSSPPFTVMSSSPSASTCFISSPKISPDLYGVSTYCVTDGTRGYSSNEWCNIRIDQNVTLHRAFFEVESGFDWIALYAPGVTVPASRPYSAPSFAWSDNRHSPVWVNASEGSRLIWSTNSSFARGGFELCAVPHCAVPQSNTSPPPPSPPPCRPETHTCAMAENFSFLFLSPLCVVMLIVCTNHLKQLHARNKARLELQRSASQARQNAAPSRARHAGRADALSVRGATVADATGVEVQMGVPVAPRAVGLVVEPVAALVHVRQSVAISGVEERRVGLDVYGEPVYGQPVAAIGARSHDNQRQSPVHGQPVSAFAVPAPYATARSAVSSAFVTADRPAAVSSAVSSAASSAASSAVSSASPTGIAPGVLVAHVTLVSGFDSPHFPAAAAVEALPAPTSSSSFHAASGEEPCVYPSVYRVDP